MKITIEQEHYLNVEVVNIEKDVIEIWVHGKSESNVILLEKKNIDKLIEILNVVK